MGIITNIKKLQRCGFKILNRLQKGITITKAEINEFRQLCFINKIVEDLDSPADALETARRRREAIQQGEATSDEYKLLSRE